MGAVMGLVGVSSWIAIVEIASQQPVDQDGDLPGGGGDRLPLTDAVGDAAVMTSAEQMTLPSEVATQKLLFDTGRAARPERTKNRRPRDLSPSLLKIVPLFYTPLHRLKHTLKNWRNRTPFIWLNRMTDRN